MLPKPNRMTRRALQELFARLARTPGRLAVTSFLVAILLGTLVLCTPLCNAKDPRTGRRPWTHPVDALFTATSAVCVTGLIVKDTGGDWSLMGQLVILFLIQAGALGIMTIYAFLVGMLRKGLSMGFEHLLGHDLEAEPAGNVGPLIKFICLFTLVAEVIGAVALFFSWRGSGNFEGFWDCAYHSVFHSISAFCNAGFSLNSGSLMSYQDSLPVNAVIWGLIIAGGLGFLVVRNLARYAKWWLLHRRGRRPKLTVHTRLVLTMTVALLLVGFFAAFASLGRDSLSDDSLRTRVLASAFQSVTPRTAGFNTVQTSTLAHSALLLVMAMMFVGGSPGSTAGGVKTSTIGVMLASIHATAHGRGQAEVFHHSVRQETVHRVASIILLSVAVLVTGMFLLLISERELITSGEFGFLDVAFEATSAFGTVGLSLGITPKLSLAGRLIVPLLMFVGRLGPVTLMMTAVVGSTRAPYTYPEGQILVG
ncbi:MAG: potassium transporter TrkG [Candidatus Brocadiia bacterium]|nr:potassium transporter TrkG [Candidatus Brocadiia bacterium]